MIAFKTFGGKETASTRLRALLPIAELRKRGVSCEVFHPDRASRYGMVIFQKAYTADDIKLAASLKQQGCVVVFDLCDNHFYNPTDDVVLQERADRLRKMVAVADVITVSTTALGELVERPYIVIDDMVDDSWYSDLARFCRPVLRLFRKRIFTVAWFGSSGSEMPRFGLVDLQMVIGELNALHQQIGIRLMVISNSESKTKQYTEAAQFPVEYHKWTQRSFPFLMQQADATIIPVDVNPFTFCKTNNRPVLSLLLGVPVVATSVPSYLPLSGFVLFENWRENLSAYAKDERLGRMHVAAGRQFIRKNFNREVISQQWISMINKYTANGKN